MIKTILSLAIVLFSLSTFGSQILSNEIFLTNKGNLRAACAVKDYLWVSGSKGSIARILVKNGKLLEIKEFTNTPCSTCDYRGIHAWDSLNAIAISSGMPCVIIKTKDGGKSWLTVFEQMDSAWFLDAIKFSKNGKGYVLTDPTNGAVPILTSSDFGSTWTVKYWSYPYLSPPSFYAASNSSFAISKKHLLLCGGINNAPFLCKVKETEDSFTLLSDYIGTPNQCTDKKENYFGYYGMHIIKNNIHTVGGSFNCPLEGQFARHFIVKKNTFKMHDSLLLGGYYSGVYAIKNKRYYAGTMGIRVYDNKRLVQQDSQIFNTVVPVGKNYIAWLGAKGKIIFAKI